MSGQPAYKRNTAPTITIDDGAGKFAALTPQAAARLRARAWEHLQRINPAGVSKARTMARTR